MATIRSHQFPAAHRITRERITGSNSQHSHVRPINWMLEAALERAHGYREIICPVDRDEA
jgi:hypothetical protein